METNPRILIAEDSLVNQKILLRMLRQFGWNADVVMTGFGALQAVDACKYDIVFMDVCMPEMDGLEATRRIINSQQSEERPRIIALTAAEQSEDREKCLEAGMDDYITKPLHLEDVIYMIKHWVPNLEMTSEKINLLKSFSRSDTFITPPIAQTKPAFC